MSKVTQWQRNEAARDDLNSNGEAGQGYALQWIGGELVRDAMDELGMVTQWKRTVQVREAMAWKGREMQC